MTGRKTAREGKNYHEDNRQAGPFPQESTIADWLPGANLAEPWT